LQRFAEGRLASYLFSVGWEIDMASNKELEAGLKAMVEDYHLPGGGRKKLSQLVAGHLAWFDAAERRGMGWRDMIGVLTTAGVTRRSGKASERRHTLLGGLAQALGSCRESGLLPPGTA
jgi:hypothetical protein